jgi:HlyD family secretion protein
MSKGRIAAVIVLSVVLIVGAIVVIAPEVDDELPATTGTATADTAKSGREWLAVAPGQVEPSAGIIKVSAPAVGVVRRILVKPNDTVFAGELLMQLNDDDVRARLTATEAQAGMRKRLRDDQPASGKSLDRRKAEDAVADAETAVFDAQAAVDKAAAEWRISGEPIQSLTEARSALARAQDNLGKRTAQLQTAAANVLPTPNDAQLTAARGDLSLMRVNLEKLKIRAPIDGTVLQLNIRPGELASPSALQPLILIANLSTLRVRAELDERDLAQVKLGQPASVRADAFPGQEFPGMVSSIAPLVEPAQLGARGPTSRTDVDAVEVIVKLNQPGPLAPGMRVDVYFAGEKVAKGGKK